MAAAKHKSNAGMRGRTGKTADVTTDATNVPIAVTTDAMIAAIGTAGPETTPAATGIAIGAATDAMAGRIIAATTVIRFVSPAMSPRAVMAIATAAGRPAIG
jgi:urease alpha subunit